MTDASPLDAVPADSDESAVTSTETSPSPLAPEPVITQDDAGAEPPVGLPGREAKPIATIDASVTQGNRVTTAEALNPESPLKRLLDKVEEHFGLGTNVVNDLRAVADELEALLNRLKVGN